MDLSNKPYSIIFIIYLQASTWFLETNNNNKILDITASSKHPSYTATQYQVFLFDMNNFQTDIFNP